MLRKGLTWLALVLIPTLLVAQAVPYDPADAPAQPDPVPGELIEVPEGANLLLNPSFETNGGVGSSTFSDWTVFDVPGSVGGVPSTFGSIVVQTGTMVTVSGNMVEAPTDGTFAAMADATGPSAKLIYQDFAVPEGTTSLSCDVYINEQSGTFIVAGTLDWESVPNQHARLDLADPAASPDDVGAGVLENLFITNPGDPSVQSYQTIAADISAYAGQTVRLRFAEVDNQFFFNAGIDNCSVTNTPPPPDDATIDVPTLGTGGIVALVLLLAAAGFVVFRRRA